MKRGLAERVRRTRAFNRLAKDRRFRLVAVAAVNMGVNLIFALFNAVISIAYLSAWNGVMCAYHAALGLIKLNIVDSERRGMSPAREKRTLLVTGAGLLALAVILSLTVMLTIRDAVLVRYHMYVTIGIAAFTFALVATAVTSAAKARKSGDGTLVMLKSVSLAAAVGSVLALERAMLGTFGGGAERFAQVVAGVSGLVGFMIAVILGALLLARARRIGRQGK